MDFEKYRKPVSKDIQAAGIAAHVKYAPARAFTQLQKFVDQGACLVPCAAVEEAGREAIAYGDYGHMSISFDIPDATLDESENMFADFMKAMALLTNDEALACIVEDAPKKKDGHLNANRVVLECRIDGAFRNGEFYALTAKTAKGDCIDIGVSRKRFNEYEGFGLGVSASELLASERFGGVARRMENGRVEAGSGQLAASCAHSGEDSKSFEKYRKPVSKDIQAAGITVHVEYSPARALSQFKRFAEEAGQGFSQSFETLLDTMACYPLTISVAQGEGGLGKKAERRCAALCTGDLVGVESQWSSAGVRLGVSAKGLKMGEGIVADDPHGAAAKRCPNTAAVAFLLPHTKATVLSTHEQPGACDGFLVRLELEPFSLDGLREEYEAYLDAPLGLRKRSSIRRREVR